MREGAVVKGERGRLVSGGELTEKQKVFICAYVANGGKGAEAAREAQYSDPGRDAWGLVRQPHIQQAIHTERERVLFTEMASEAMGTMRYLNKEGGKGDQVRFQAAKWTLEAVGHGLAARAVASGMMDSDKPLAEMTLGELEKFITESEKRLKQARVVEVVTQTVAQTDLAPDVARNASETQG